MCYTHSSISTNMHRVLTTLNYEMEAVPINLSELQE